MVLNIKKKHIIRKLFLDDYKLNYNDCFTIAKKVLNYHLNVNINIEYKEAYNNLKTIADIILFIDQLENIRKYKVIRKDILYSLDKDSIIIDENKDIFFKLGFINNENFIYKVIKKNNYFIINGINKPRIIINLC